MYGENTNPNINEKINELEVLKVVRCGKRKAFLQDYDAEKPLVNIEYCINTECRYYRGYNASSETLRCAY